MARQQDRKREETMPKCRDGIEVEMERKEIDPADALKKPGKPKVQHGWRTQIVQKHRKKNMGKKR